MKIINVKVGFFLGIILLSAVATRGFAITHRENTVDESNDFPSSHQLFYDQIVKLLEKSLTSGNDADSIKLLKYVTFTKAAPNIYQRLSRLLNQINLALQSDALYQETRLNLVRMGALLSAVNVPDNVPFSRQLFYTQIVESLEESLTSRNDVDFINILKSVTFTKAAPNIYQRLGGLLSQINLALQGSASCQEMPLQLVRMGALLSAVDESNKFLFFRQMFYVQIVKLLEESLTSRKDVDFINILKYVTFTKAVPNICQRLGGLLNQINLALQSDALYQEARLNLVRMGALLSAMDESNNFLFVRQVFYVQIVESLEESLTSRNDVDFINMLKYVNFTGAESDIYEKLAGLLNQINLKIKSGVSCQKERLRLTQMATLLVETLPIKFCFSTSASQ